MPGSAQGVRDGEGKEMKLGTIGKPLPDAETDKEFQANWKITREEEERLLLQFHERLVNASLYRPDHDKYYIRRFLRARQHDLEKATQFYADHIKWRKENNVDEIMTNFDFHERDVFLTLYPQGYHKTDKLGRPIYIQHLGAINIKKLTEVTSEDRMLKFHIQEYERCTKYIMQACSRVSGHHVDQTFAIIDVTGVGLSHMTGQVKALLGKITAIDQANYPEMMGKTLIINAPGVFKLVWGVVKRFLDARTLTKIELLGTNYQSQLLNYIDKDNLPEYLGGNSKATLLDDVGPWKDQKIIDEINADFRAASSHDVEADGTQRVAESEPVVTNRSESGNLGVSHSPGRRLTRISSRSKSQQYQLPTRANLDGIGRNDENFSDAVELQTRATSFASEGEDGYYSPRSDSNFSSFTDRTQLEEEPILHPRLNAADRKTGSVNERHMSLAMRIRRLENAVPELKEKLKVNLTRFENGGYTATGGNDTLARVEALEDAVEILFAIQEENLQAPGVADDMQKSGGKETRGEEKDTCCGCCSIM